MQLKVTSTTTLRVRTGASITAPIAGSFQPGDVVEGTLDSGWGKLALTAGGKSINGYGYAKADWLQPVVTTPTNPTPVSAFNLGLNVLGNVGAAMEEAARGCRHFLVMDSFVGASQLKQAYPDATVMVRRWLQSRPTVEQMIGGLEGAGNKNLIYTGTNEADVMGQGGPGLVERAKFDIAVAQRIRQISGATYAAGTFSVGTPDFTNPAECDIIRSLYAPAYNSGLIAFDMHLYSPNMAHVSKPQEHIWFERRWEFLFTKCGFDPRIRAIYCSECGVDEGNVGGFKAHGISQAEFTAWCNAYVALQTAPLVVDGKSYPSPILGGAIFQLGGNGDAKWDGYNVLGYLPSLRSFYSAPKAATNVIQRATARVMRAIHTAR
jgi:hypothetical protein